jgi:hypothetical protein
MTPIHVAGEMAVWSEDKWAAFESELQGQLRAERRRLERLATRPNQRRGTMLHVMGWTLLSATLLLALFY